MPWQPFWLLRLSLAQEARKSQSASPDSEEIKRQKLETIQKEIAALRQEAARLNEQENSVLLQLSQYEVQSQIQTREISVFQLKQEKTERDIGSLQKEYEYLKKNLGKQKQYLTHRLVEAYKLGELNYIKLVDESESIRGPYAELSVHYVSCKG